MSFAHPDLEPILAETYGIAVYQEQVIEMAVRVAGYTMGQADLLRKAMGKKIASVMAAERERFVAGATANGYERQFAVRLFGDIEHFAGYGFNKSHSTGYGLISYQTAWLKATYPVEYMAALLTSVKNRKDRLPQYLNECRVMGITVLPPDVNDSDLDFTPRGEQIRFGLSAVRNVGESVVEEVVRARRERGRFTDFRDFCEKVDGSVLNRRVIESLIRAGAFASLGHSRRGLLDVYEPVVDAAATRKRAEAAGQFSLFGSEGGGPALDPPVPLTVPDEEFPKAQLLAMEREMLGLYVSDHPLFGAERLLSELADLTLGELRARLEQDDREASELVTVGGVLLGLGKRFTKKGEPYLVGTLEDLTSAVDVIFFPSVYRDARDLLVEDGVVVVRARLDYRDEALKLIAIEVSSPDLTDVRGSPLVVRLAVPQCTGDAIERLTSILAAHPGHVPVHVEVQGTERATVFKLGDDYRVSRRAGLFGELKAVFGPDAVTDGRAAHATA